MAEKRVGQRAELLYYLEIRDSSDKKIIGRLGDISEGGLMIISEEPVILHTRYFITLNLPDTNNFPVKSIEVVVNTCWQRPDYNPKYTCTGCEFIFLRENDRSIVKRLIRIFSYS